MPNWTPFAHAQDLQWTPASTVEHWQRLHRGDAEPCPTHTAVLAAWVLFHNGAFEQATAAGLAAGGDGLTVANKATALYANYLEHGEQTRLELFQQVAERAEAQAAKNPENPNAWYWHAYALTRYGQCISVARGLALGLGAKVKASLERAIALAPQHADARIALGAFHADVIDKMGPLIGGMTYGARKETALSMLQEALSIHPDSAAGKTEWANALLMLEGDARMDDATALYEQAAHSAPVDAAEYLEVEMARLELQD